MLIDHSLNDQNYIEDCEVCCNPIQLNVKIEDEELVAFEASNIEQ